MKTLRSIIVLVVELLLALLPTEDSEDVWVLSTHLKCAPSVGRTINDDVGVVYWTLGKLYVDDLQLPTAGRIAGIFRERMWRLEKSRWVQVATIFVVEFLMALLPTEKDEDQFGEMTYLAYVPSVRRYLSSMDNIGHHWLLGGVLATSHNAPGTVRLIGRFKSAWRNSFRSGRPGLFLRYWRTY